MAEMGGPITATDTRLRALTGFGSEGEWRGHVLLIGMTLVHLIPLWVFQYIPTNDGPSHVYNALILKDFDAPTARYREFFEVRWEQLPNLTSHVVLAAMMYIWSPVVAEKALVSIYVIGFVLAVRYFLRSLGGDRDRFAPIVFLFTYNACFWLGFYNYCLSLILFWIVFGYSIRHRRDFGMQNGLVLGALLFAAYVTHLVGFALSLLAALWIGCCVGPRSPRKAVWTAAAVLPSLPLAFEYSIRSGLIGAHGIAGVFQPTPKVQLVDSPADSLHRLLAADLYVFGDYIRQAPLVVWAAVLLFMLLLLIHMHGSLKAAGTPVDRRTDTDYTFVLFSFAATITAMCLFLPNHFGKHGGYLYPRLLVLLPILFLGSIRPHFSSRVRRAGEAAVLCAVAMNFVAVTIQFHTTNRDIREYTRGTGEVGANRAFVFVNHRSRGLLANHLANAASYYCYENGAVNVTNYEASKSHFPVRFVGSASLGLTNPLAYAAQGAVDTILVWNDTHSKIAGLPTRFQEVFRSCRLSIFRDKSDENRAGMGRISGASEARQQSSTL